MEKTIQTVGMELEQLWQELLANDPTHSDFVQVIREIPFLREDAGRELLKRGPTKEHLQFIKEQVPALHLEVARLTLKQNPNANDILNAMEFLELRPQAIAKVEVKKLDHWDLVRAIKHAPELLEVALQELIRRKCYFELREVIKGIPGTRAMAAETLLARYTRDTDGEKVDLYCIFEHVPMFRARVWEIFQTKEADEFPNFLCWAMVHFADFQEHAWNALNASGCSLEVLCRIVLHVPSYRAKAWAMLASENLETETLVEFMQAAPELVDDVWAIIAERNLSVDRLQRILIDVPALRERIGYIVAERVSRDANRRKALEKMKKLIS